MRIRGYDLRIFMYTAGYKTKIPVVVSGVNMLPVCGIVDCGPRRENNDIGVCYVGLNSV